MKKVLNAIAIIFVVLGAVLIGIGPIFPAIIVTNTTTIQNPFEAAILTFSVTSYFYFAAIGVGLALVLLGKKIVKAVGYGLLLSDSLIVIGGFVVVIDGINGDATRLIGPGAIIALIGVVFLLAAFICDIIFTRLLTEPTVAPDVHDILVWKDLLDKGVITQDEFEVKKKEILHLGGTAPSAPTQK